MLIAFNKPFGVMSQFTREVAEQRTLAEFGFPPEVYPVGRLDQDSEGLILLTDEASLNHLLLDPARGHSRQYLAQVEGDPTPPKLEELRRGVLIRTKKGQEPRRTLPCRAWVLSEPPTLWERDPPIRFRANIPTSWVAIELVEGRNRQVRRMTAVIDCPTLRLVRVKMAGLALADLSLAPGAWRELTGAERKQLFAH